MKRHNGRPFGSIARASNRKITAPVWTSYRALGADCPADDRMSRLAYAYGASNAAFAARLLDACESSLEEAAEYDDYHRRT